MEEEEGNSLWGSLPSSTHSVNIAEHHQLLITVPGSREKDGTKQTKVTAFSGSHTSRGDRP